jgi:hypothetical protein
MITQSIAANLAAALLHEERRCHYVSREVMCMLRLREQVLLLLSLLLLVLVTTRKLLLDPTECICCPTCCVVVMLECQYDMVVMRPECMQSSNVVCAAIS